MVLRPLMVRSENRQVGVLLVEARHRDLLVVHHVEDDADGKTGNHLDGEVCQEQLRVVLNEMLIDLSRGHYSSFQ